MSDYPPPPNVGPGPWVDYGADPPAPPRPTSITVISIFGIILGSLGLLCGAIGLVTQVLMLAMRGRNSAAPMFAPMSDPLINTYGAISTVVNLLLSAVLLAAGIGGLKLRPLARRAMIAVSAAVMVWATLNTIMQVVWIGPRSIEYSHRVQAQMGMPKAPTLPKGLESGIQLGGAMVGWVLWCALPVGVLIFWRSPRVIAAFESSSPPPEAGGP